jgi:hypothetical protein
MFKILTEKQKTEVLEAIRQEIKELENLANTEDSILNALYEYLKDCDVDYIEYYLEKIYNEFNEYERFKLGILLILSTTYPTGFNIYQSLKA